MSTDLKPYTSLKQIVSYALDECDKSDGDMDKWWILAFRGLVDLLYDISAEPLTVRLPLNGNKTVNFPADCMGWLKIGILNNLGEISTLKINNALTTYKDTNPNRLQSLTPDIQDGFPLLLNNPFYLNYYLNGYYQPLFGVGGGLIQYGECRVDENSRVVILSPEFQYDHIMFEYWSSPQKNDDYQVETYLQEALIAFIKWKAKVGSRDEYIAEKTNARRRAPKKKVHLQNINQVLRESTGMKMRS